MSDPAGSALRVLLRATDPVRRQGLAAMVTAAGHLDVADAPDVVLCDLPHGMAPPMEAEAPVVLLTNAPSAGDQPAGILSHEVTPAQLDAALRAVATGLLVRTPDTMPADGFRAVADDTMTPLLTPREAEVLALVGQGMSNKAVARHLGISVHTVKFHLEALFAKLDATSRAEAVAKGLRGGVIEL